MSRESAKALLKVLIPVPLRPAARRLHRRWVLDRTITRLSRSVRLGGEMRRVEMARAAYGWANEGWSASTDFILAAFEAVKLTEGPILECGSGLSTILVAVAAEELGREVWSLEHEPDWAERVRAELRRHRIASARVLTCGLKDYGEFAWYELPPENLPRDFDLVVCDGPPADTPGGRIGLLPLLADHLRPGCVILLDDTSRAVERNILEGWAEQLGCTALRFGPDESIGYLQKPRA